MRLHFRANLTCLPGIVLLFTVLFSTVPVFADWPDTGLQVTPPGCTGRYKVVPDGVGGAYIGWYVEVSPDMMGSLVQHIDADGNILWDPQGISAVDPDSAHRTIFYDLLADGEGNLLVLSIARLLDQVGSFFTVQKLSPSGERLWGATGRSVTGDSSSTTDAGFSDPMVLDENGNIIVIYMAMDDDELLCFSSKLDTNGDVVWTTLLGDHFTSHGQCVPDGEGGVIYARRGVNADYDHAILGARVDSEGNSVWWPSNYYLLNRQPDNNVYPTQHFKLIPRPSGGALMVAQSFSASNIPPCEFLLVVIEPDGDFPLGPRGATIFRCDDMVDFDMVMHDDILYVSLYNRDSPPERGHYVFRTDENGTLLDPGGYVEFDTTSLRGSEVRIEPTTDHLLIAYSRKVSPTNSTRYPHCQAFTAEGSFPWGAVGHLIADTTLPYDGYRLQTCNVGGDTVFVAWMPNETSVVTVMPVYPDGSTPWYDNPVQERSTAPNPQSFRIDSVYPQPFNHQVHISFFLPEPDRVTFTIYNLNGQVVQNMTHHFEQAGQQVMNLDLKTTAAGVFYIKVISGDQSCVSKLVHIK